MADLTSRRVYETLGVTHRFPGKSKASTTYYVGEALVYDANGLLAKPIDAAALIPAGIYTGFGIRPGNDSLVAGSGESLDMETFVGYIWLPFATAAQTDVGELFYLADSGTVIKTAAAKTYGLICRGFKPGYVLLDFVAPVKVA